MSRQGHRFEPGRVVATPGALGLLRRYDSTSAEYLGRHLSGDWGAIDAHDKRENERALRTGARLFSAYAVSPLNILWIVTEAYCSSTYLLRPEDY